MTGKEMLKLYKKHGWVVDRINGSHYILKKSNSVQVIPVHGKELPTGMENALKKNLK